MSDYSSILVVDDGKTATTYAVRADGTRVKIDLATEKLITEQITKVSPSEIEKRVAVLEAALAALQKQVATYHPVKEIIK